MEEQFINEEDIDRIIKETDHELELPFVSEIRFRDRHQILKTANFVKDKIANEFRKQLEIKAEEFRSNSKKLADELMERISVVSMTTEELVLKIKPTLDLLETIQGLKQKLEEEKQLFMKVTKVAREKLEEKERK